MIHTAQVNLGTETCIAYMLMSGIIGLMMDRLLLLGESVILRWKR